MFARMALGVLLAAVVWFGAVTYTGWKEKH